MKEKIIFSWSGGKDSASALYELIKTGNYEITALLTTLTEQYNRVSIHGVREILLDRQAQSLGFAIEKVFILKNCSEKDYELKMKQVLEKYLAIGVRTAAFGDVFLEDLRKQRQNNLSKIDMKAVFPIWKKDTAELAHKFIDSGFKAIITSVDLNICDRTFIGRDFNKEFLSELPPNIDPCGENGEFHSFVYDGPIFQKPVAHKKGKVVLRENRFYYCDLIPLENKDLSMLAEPL